MNIIKKIAVLGLISTQLLASEEYLNQLTKPSYESLNSQFSNSISITSKYIEIPQELCDKNLFDCYFNLKLSEEDLVTGFTFTNESKNSINPRTSANGSRREYRFSFEERSLQDIKIEITEDSGISGLMSHDLLETTITFLPRKVIPYVDFTNLTDNQFKITLGTGETISINAKENTIEEGVLIEKPMDMEPSRHKRKFAQLEYTGKGIMIRVDRRAGTPEHIYSQSFNSNEDIRNATLTYQGKICKVKKELIWANAQDPDKGAYLKYASDQEFLDKVINPICKWNLTLIDISI